MENYKVQKFTAEGYVMPYITNVINCCKRLYEIELFYRPFKKVQVGKDQEKAQSEKDSHSKNQGGKKPN